MGAAPDEGSVGHRQPWRRWPRSRGRILGASKQLAPLLLEAASEHETAQTNDGGDGSDA